MYDNRDSRDYFVHDNRFLLFQYCPTLLSLFVYQYLFCDFQCYCDNHHKKFSDLTSVAI